MQYVNASLHPINLKIFFYKIYRIICYVKNNIQM